MKIARLKVEDGEQAIIDRINVLAMLFGKISAAAPDASGHTHHRVIGAFDAIHEQFLLQVMATIETYIAPLRLRIEEHRSAPGNMKVLVCSWGRESRKLESQKSKVKSSDLRPSTFDL